MSYTKLASGVLFPIQERLKGHATVSIRKAMEQSQWWSREELERYRLQRLRGFLETVGRDVPYYRELFEAVVFDPQQLSSLSGLDSLPFLDKAVIRANAEALKSDAAEGLSRFNTGGSSGEPLIFWLGKERVSHDVAAKWRATRWWGVDIGDPEIVLWGSPIELGGQGRLQQLRDRLLRSELLPAFEMSDEKIERFLNRIRDVRPRMLFGYPSAFALLAAFGRQHGIQLDDIGIKVAFVTSERLYDHQRALIEEVFGCPVANGYGGRDAGFIAHQCPAGGMHITAEDIIVEIVSGDGKPLPAGECGEIVITHMATSDFPFIRYRTGDMGVLTDAPCSCGRGLPLLKEIHGRNTDFIVARNGTRMHGLALIYTLRDIDGIAEFKIVQESLDETVVFVVWEAGESPAAVDRIRTEFGERLGDSVRINVRTVEQIEAEASGKFRYVVSKVDSSV